MKKLAVLAVFAGLIAGCCGLFECKKNADGTVATSCCGCSHDHGAAGHHHEKIVATENVSEKSASLDAELKSSVPVEGAEMLAETAHSVEVAAL